MQGYLFWIIMIIVLSIIEGVTVNLVTIWFVASALVSLVLSFIIDNFFIEFLVFVVLGIILMLSTRKVLKKYLLKNKEKTNLDRVVGMTGVVTADIKKNEIGEVKVDGKRWSAISNCNIPKGTYVTIKELKGVKLIVEKKESDVK